MKNIYISTQYKSFRSISKLLQKLNQFFLLKNILILWSWGPGQHWQLNEAVSRMKKQNHSTLSLYVIIVSSSSAIVTYELCRNILEGGEKTKTIKNQNTIASSVNMFFHKNYWANLYQILFVVTVKEWDIQNCKFHDPHTHTKRTY